MNVQVLLGRANTGKTGYILSRLAAHQRAGEKAVLIVPEQYTFEAEHILSERLSGLLGVEVLSFARLNERILRLSGQSTPFLSPQGHRMVIRRSALTCKDSLLAFSRVAEKPGFAAQMQSVFSDLAHAGISPAALTEYAKRLPEGSALCGKLSDIATLYAETDAFLQQRYLTLDDAADRARELLPSSYLAGLPVYIDGVDRPSEQMYQWLAALMRCAGSLTIALCLDPASPPDADVFTPDALVLARMHDLASQFSIPLSTLVCDKAAAKTAPALCHLERNLFASPAGRYPHPAPEITVFAASDRLAETEALADAIQAQARAGIRYREMAVIVSAPDAYMLLISRVFGRRGIPVFLDRKRPVSGHAAVSALLYAIAAVCDDFPANDVLALAKSGYADVSRDDAEALELYLLRTGLRGNALLTPFSRGTVPAAAEHARDACVRPLVRLRAGLNGRTVSEKVRAVYAYLTDIHLCEKLQARAETLLAEGRIPLMEEHAQVWNTLVTLLDQLDAIMGDVSMRRDAFRALLAEGLSGLELGVIPSTSDAVLIGDLARTKSRAVRALFLLGVNDGLLPAARGDDGVIDDRELTAMERAGIPVWAKSRTRAAADRLDLYTALSKARETLFVSYSFTGDGAELAASPLVSDILRIFPYAKRNTDIIDTDVPPVCEERGMTMLMQDLCALHTDEVVTKRLPTLLEYYGKNSAYAARVRKMLAMGRMRFSPAPFGRQLASALYGDSIRMSASRLEQFASCPFRHFMRYGLAAADRKEYTERAADMGTFYHAVLAAFVQRVTGGEPGWNALSDADCDAILDDLLPGLIAEHNDGIFLHNERLRATLFLTVESIRRSAHAIVAQVHGGAFTPLGAELRFGEGGAFPPLVLTLPDGGSAELSGIIDRVDTAKADGATVLRVVDYKLGGRDFDFSAILHGLALQLPLYLIAASQGGAPAGMYYMPLTMRPVPDTETLTDALTEAFRLKGLTLSDPSIVLANDHALKEGDPAVLGGVRRSEDGRFSGSVCRQSELNALLDRAYATSEKLLSGMLGGHIEADPAEHACQYCDYRSACRFDPMVRGCRTRKYKKLKQAEFFELIGGDAHALDR